MIDFNKNLQTSASAVSTNGVVEVSTPVQKHKTFKIISSVKKSPRKKLTKENRNFLKIIGLLK